MSSSMSARPESPARVEAAQLPRLPQCPGLHGNVDATVSWADAVLASVSLTGWHAVLGHGYKQIGSCDYGRKLIRISKHLIAQATDAQIRETVLHEVAHALTPGQNHNEVWRQVFISLGGSGRRTHSVQLSGYRPRQHSVRTEVRVGLFTFHLGDEVRVPGWGWCEITKINRSRVIVKIPGQTRPGAVPFRMLPLLKTNS